MESPAFMLNPGPASASSHTLRALATPVVYHNDPYFVERFRRTQERLAQIMETQQDVVVMQGECMMGLEAAARSIVTPGMKCLNLISGIYGKGMGMWLRSFGAEVIEIEVPFRDVVDAPAVARAFEEHRGIQLVTVVHSETPCGTLTPVESIGPIAKEYGALTMVDAASTLGGVPLRPDEWKLDVCVGASQKCLGAPAGLSLMTVSDDAWEVMRANPNAPRASILSLLDWKEMWLDEGRFPLTPSISDIYGLDAACGEVLEIGVARYFARHERAAAACRAGVAAMGLELFPRSAEIASPCLTAIVLPEGIEDVQLCRLVRERYDVVLGDSEGAGNIVRIGHMGVQARSFGPLAGLCALGRGLMELGVQVKLGEGLEAAAMLVDQVALETA
ncbi:MAG TPA: alanine--glyoxylate aminotransferase family protein [Solirubrobacteraceae bacterium]|nr:alanine--glyoxylate aminotransferase family protein [Solirubrobacteraceae bacterium]